MRSGKVRKRTPKKRTRGVRRSTRKSLKRSSKKSLRRYKKSLKRSSKKRTRGVRRSTRKSLSKSLRRSLRKSLRRSNRKSLRRSLRRSNRKIGGKRMVGGSALSDSKRRKDEKRGVQGTYARSQAAALLAPQAAFIRPPAQRVAYVMTWEQLTIAERENAKGFNWVDGQSWGQENTRRIPSDWASLGEEGLNSASLLGYTKYSWGDAWKAQEAQEAKREPTPVGGGGQQYVPPPVLPPPKEVRPRPQPISGARGQAPPPPPPANVVAAAAESKGRDFHLKVIPVGLFTKSTKAKIFRVTAETIDELKRNIMNEMDYEDYPSDGVDLWVNKSGATPIKIESLDDIGSNIWTVQLWKTGEAPSNSPSKSPPKSPSGGVEEQRVAGSTPRGINELTGEDNVGRHILYLAKEIRATFNQYDTGNTGFINKTEFEKAFQDMEISINGKKIAPIVVTSTTGDNVDYNLFLDSIGGVDWGPPRHLDTLRRATARPKREVRVDSDEDWVAPDEVLVSRFRQLTIQQWLAGYKLDKLLDIFEDGFVEEMERTRVPDGEGDESWVALAQSATVDDVAIFLVPTSDIDDLRKLGISDEEARVLWPSIASIKAAEDGTPVGWTKEEQKRFNEDPWNEGGLKVFDAETLEIGAPGESPWSAALDPDSVEQESLVAGRVDPTEDEEENKAKLALTKLINVRQQGQQGHTTPQDRQKTIIDAIKFDEEGSQNIRDAFTAESVESSDLPDEVYDLRGENKFITLENLGDIISKIGVPNSGNGEVVITDGVWSNCPQNYDCLQIEIYEEPIASVLMDTAFSSGDILVSENWLIDYPNFLTKVANMSPEVPEQGFPTLTSQERRGDWDQSESVVRGSAQSRERLGDPGQSESVVGGSAQSLNDLVGKAERKLHSDSREFGDKKALFLCGENNGDITCAGVDNQGSAVRLFTADAPEQPPQYRGQARFSVVGAGSTPRSPQLGPSPLSADVFDREPVTIGSRQVVGGDAPPTDFGAGVPLSGSSARQPTVSHLAQVVGGDAPPADFDAGVLLSAPRAGQPAVSQLAQVVGGDAPPADFDAQEAEERELGADERAEDRAPWLLPSREKAWFYMGETERLAATNLGWTHESWNEGKVSPFSWDDFTSENKSDATTLGFAKEDFRMSAREIEGTYFRTEDTPHALAGRKAKVTVYAPPPRDLRAGVERGGAYNVPNHGWQTGVIVGVKGGPSAEEILTDAASRVEAGESETDVQADMNRKLAEQEGKDLIIRLEDGQAIEFPWKDQIVEISGSPGPNVLVKSLTEDQYEAAKVAGVQVKADVTVKPGGVVPDARSAAQEQAPTPLRISDAEGVIAHLVNGDYHPALLSTGEGRKSNGKIVYEKVGDQNISLWYSKTKWCVGKNGDIGDNRCYASFISKSATPVSLRASKSWRVVTGDGAMQEQTEVRVRKIQAQEPQQQGIAQLDVELLEHSRNNLRVKLEPSIGIYEGPVKEFDFDKSGTIEGLIQTLIGIAKDLPSGMIDKTYLWELVPTEQVLDAPATIKLNRSRLAGLVQKLPQKEGEYVRVRLALDPKTNNQLPVLIDYLRNQGSERLIAFTKILRIADMQYPDREAPLVAARGGDLTYILDAVAPEVERVGVTDKYKPRAGAFVGEELTVNDDNDVLLGGKFVGKLDSINDRILLDQHLGMISWDINNRKFTELETYNKTTDLMTDTEKRYLSTLGIDEAAWDQGPAWRELYTKVWAKFTPAEATAVRGLGMRPNQFSGGAAGASASAGGVAAGASASAGGVAAAGTEEAPQKFEISGFKTPNKNGTYTKSTRVNDGFYVYDKELTQGEVGDKSIWYYKYPTDDGGQWMIGERSKEGGKVCFALLSSTYSAPSSLGSNGVTWRVPVAGKWEDIGGVIVTPVGTPVVLQASAGGAGGAGGAVDAAGGPEIKSLKITSNLSTMEAPFADLSQSPYTFNEETNRWVSNKKGFTLARYENENDDQGGWAIYSENIPEPNEPLLHWIESDAEFPHLIGVKPWGSNYRSDDPALIVTIAEINP